jgi:hypothetical protein
LVLSNRRPEHERIPISRNCLCYATFSSVELPPLGACQTHRNVHLLWHHTHNGLNWFTFKHPLSATHRGQSDTRNHSTLTVFASILPPLLALFLFVHRLNSATKLAVAFLVTAPTSLTLVMNTVQATHFVEISTCTTQRKRSPAHRRGRSRSDVCTDTPTGRAAGMSLKSSLNARRQTLESLTSQQRQRPRKSILVRRSSHTHDQHLAFSRPPTRPHIGMFAPCAA